MPAAKKPNKSSAKTSLPGRLPSLRTSELMVAAHAAADAAGAAILPYFRKRLTVDNKDGAGGFDPVTRADRAAERAISRTILAHFPDHGLAGEEYGAKNEAARHRWIIDPIDGTKAFILGLPTWGTLIGLLDGRNPLIGVMDQPYTRERFWSDGKRSVLRSADGTEKKLKTRDCHRLADAMLMTTTPDMFAGVEMDRFLAAKASCRMTRYGADCYAYCLVAAGHADIVIEAGLKQVDIVPLIPIIEAAGGCVTDWNGAPPIDGGRAVASANPKLHEQALKLLAR